MKHYSLRKQLIGWISIPIGIAVLLTLVLSYYFARHEIEEVYDAQLAHSAKVLLQLTQHEITEDEGFHLGLENPELQHRYERKLGFRIWVANELLTRSANTEAFGDFEAPPGFSNHTVDKKEWRFFVFLDPDHKIKIEVSERYDIRYELVIQLMSSLLIPGMVFLPVIFLVVWVGVRKVLRPVIKLSADVDQRGSNDLSSIPFGRLPEEIAPFIEALNRLFSRLEESFKQEREFTDHAAHELRTPLAAMKTQTQVLAKKAKDIPDCQEGLDNLELSINRATHLVDQLLSLARLQHENLPLSNVNLTDLIEDVICETKTRAKEKSIKLHLDLIKDFKIQAHADSLAILIGNLIDNAIKYSPKNSEITIKLDKKGQLDIIDQGPGLHYSDKIRVFKRFVRADTSGQNGSGLGLSIAQWIAHAHHTEIELLDNEPNGLIAHIEWEK